MQLQWTDGIIYKAKFIAAQISQIYQVSGAEPWLRAEPAGEGLLGRAGGSGSTGDLFPLSLSSLNLTPPLNCALCPSALYRKVY